MKLCFVVVLLFTYKYYAQWNEEHKKNTHLLMAFFRHAIWLNTS
jgi:hypothetical protein